MPRPGTGPGVCVTAKGYLRITRRGPHRDKLVHRVVMAGLCRQFCYYPLNGGGLPEGMEVHHQDFDKTHNCPSNLLLLDPALHSEMDMAARARKWGFRYVNGGHPELCAGPPVLFSCPACGRVREVPSQAPRLPADAPDWVREDWA